MTRLLSLALVFAAGACTDQGSLVFVEATQSGLAEPVTSLKVPVRIGQTTREFAIPLESPSSTTISFAIRLPPSLEGDINVHVDAYSANQILLGSGGASGSIRRGARTDLTVALVGSSPTDMAQDLYGVDLTTVDADDMKSVQTWKDRSPMAAKGLTVFSVWGAGGDDVFAVGTGGLAMHTSDHGVTWSAVATSGINDLYSVWGFAGSDVYAVGDSSIFHSTDHGVSWKAAPSGSSFATTQFRAVAGAGTVAVATALTGDVAKWNGSQWAFVSPKPASFDLNGAFAVGCGASKTCFYVVGSSGMDISSTDGAGASWAGGSVSGPTSHANAVGGTSASNWFAVGDFGILHTSNGGSTFNPPTTVPASVASGKMRGVWVAGSEVYVVGDSGAFVHSVDGGGTFANVAIPASASTTDFRGIGGASTTDIYAVGSDGMVLHLE